MEFVNQYHETLSKLLDKHAPKQIKSEQVRPPSPRMSLEIVVAKRRRQYLERNWRRTRPLLDRSRCAKLLHRCNHMVSEAKSDYYTNFTNSENPRQMWKSITQFYIGRKHCLNILHCIHCVVLFQHTSHIRLLAFDRILSLMILTMIFLQHVFPIATIINLSIQDGVVPRDIKQALVNPLIKKQLCVKIT